MNPRTIPVDKVCPSCQTVFQVCPPGKRSRLYPPNETVYCSRTCANHGRYRSGSSCNELSPVDAAYLAGLIDGEGCFVLFMRRDVVANRISIANNKPGVLEWVKQVTGVGAIIVHHRQSEKWATGYTYAANADAAFQMAEQIRPYLKIKAEQCDLFLEIRENLQNPSKKADRSWHFPAYERMRKLNRRGPVDTQ